MSRNAANQSGQPFDPAQWASLQEAARLIDQARREKRLIAVWGHDDIDGIASTAIMLDALDDGSIYYIPPKTGTHYGLDRAIIDQLLDRGVSLLITVDSGISSLEEAEYAASRGLELVITDHHELPGKLPQARCLVNPKMPEEKKPSIHLSGAGVALYLAAAVDGESSEGWLTRKPSRTAWAALATVSDRVPLIEDNRHIIRAGLPFLQTDQAFVRLNDLLGISNVHGLSPKIVSQTYVGLLSSNISRGFSHETLELLRGSFDQDRWKHLYAEEQLWLNRMEDEVAAKTALALADDQPLKLIVDRQLPWSLVGPVAGGVRDRTGCPVVIIGNKNGLSAGECRGFEPFDFVSMLNDLKDHFVQYGGHKPAAGFTIREGREEELLAALRGYGHKKKELILSSKPAERTDHELSGLEEIEAMLSKVKDQAPYGPGNRPPVFHIKDISLPEYCQSGDRYWLKYLLANRRNQDFKRYDCHCTLDVTHLDNFYLDIISISPIS